jgi:17beta-estradiol 17-dehydrogenase / very-long-chain 3-oxoacyl-CoA reductase
MSSYATALTDRIQQLDLPAISSQLLRDARGRPLIGALATIGAIWASRQLYDISTFTWVHFIRSSKLDRYKGTPSNPAWALVTGASDGIGKGFAEELSARGFNVVLHGRTEAKLNRVKADLQKQWPQRSYRIVTIDASHEAGDDAKLTAIAKSLEDINLKVLINNVGGDGGAKRVMDTYTSRPASEVDGFIDVNARFAAQITRAVLPQLMRTQPALIISIGSGASEIPTPYLALYSGAKAFNRAWARGLRAEMKQEGHDIEVLHIMVGLVATNAVGSQKPGGVVASARGMAKSSLDAVGCGREDLWAFLPHALQWVILERMPRKIIEDFSSDIAKKMMAEDERRVQKEA